MNIKLNDGQQLDLKPDFKLSVTLNNPMLSEQASMSLPVVLPESNRRKLGFPNRLDQTHKIKRVFNTIIEAGAYRKPALLRTSSYDKGTVGAFYLNESEMYAKMKEVELSQAFQIIRKASDFHVDGEFIEPMDMMIKYLELVMFDNIKDDFYLFPVATNSYERTIKRKQYSGEEREDTGTFYNVLNEYMTTTDGFAQWIYDTDQNGVKYYKLAGRVARKIFEGTDNPIEVPKGYGITPFLKRSFVLHRIFEYFGYQLRESVFDTDPEMQKEVLINNTADAIIKGELNYAQLVPSGTINEYLDSVRIDYGCEFFISPDHKYVEVKFWNDILTNKKYISLDDKVSGIAIPTLSDAQFIKLTAKRGLEGTSQNFDTIDKFERNYGPVKYREDTTIESGETIETGYYYVPKKGTVFYYDSSQIGRYRWKTISTAFFDYYEEKEDTDYDTHDSNREYIAEKTVSIRPSDDSFPSEKRPDGGSRGMYSYSEVLLHIGAVRHLNTSLEITKTDVEGKSNTETKKDDSTSCPIVTAFFRGRGSKKKPQDYNSLKVWANTFALDNAAPYYSLVFGGETGLYNKYWKKYGDVIKHSFNQFNIPLHFTIRDILEFRFDNVYLFKGQPLIPEKLEFEIDRNNDINVVNALFRTIRLYTD